MTSPLLAKLPNDWDKLLAQEYMAGASDVEVMASLRITKGLFDKLYSEPETGVFKELVDFGRLMSKAWWYRQGRTNLDSRQFNGNLWYQIMKNRYGWSDKTTTTTKTATEMDAVELEARLEEAFKKYKKVSRT